MRVSEVMIRNPITVGPMTPVVEVARLMRDRKISSVILTKNERPVGIITERDLVWRVLASGRDPGSLTAFDVSSRPVIAVPELADVEDALELMRRHEIRRVVVVDNQDRVVGILTTDDLGYNLKRMSEELAIKYIITMRRSKDEKESKR
ncbi:MAG: CBS domain-containing protein [Candidatus Bathyarchaeia archaeon]|nr:CBS domain-containing protein [Candidatus Bathyarchaeota archaeon]